MKGRFDEKYTFASEAAVPALEAVRTALGDLGPDVHINKNTMYVPGIPEGEPQKIERNLESYWWDHDSICLIHWVGKAHLTLEYSGAWEKFEKIDVIIKSLGGTAAHTPAQWTGERMSQSSASVMKWSKPIFAVGVIAISAIIFGWWGLIIALAAMLVLAGLYVVMLAKSFRR